MACSSPAAPSTSWIRWSRPWATSSPAIWTRRRRSDWPTTPTPSGRPRPRWPACMPSWPVSWSRRLPPTTRPSATTWRRQGKRGGRPWGCKASPIWRSGCRMNAIWPWCARRCQGCLRSRSTPCARAWKTPPCPRRCKVPCSSASARSRSAPTPVPRPWPTCAGHWPPAQAMPCAATSC
ncbi:hypothetical protein D3C72_1806660 [compost metagenome]